MLRLPKPKSHGGTPWVARIRLYFSVASIGIAIAVLNTLLMPLITIEYFWLSSIVGMIVTFVALMAIYMRGMNGVFSTTGLLWRGFLMANIVIVADIIVALAAGTGGSMWANMQLA